MISRVFGKTKPINYALVFGFLVLCLFLAQLRLIHFGNNHHSIGVSLLTLIGLFSSAVAGNYLAISNQLIAPHVYTVYVYALLVLLFPNVLLDYKPVLANLFLLGAQIRLNQMRPFKIIKVNVFDASLMVLAASLFLEWCVLFLALIWVYVYAFSPLKPRNWLVPFAAIIGFMLILSAILFLSDNIAFLAQHYRLHVSLTNWRLSNTVYHRVLGFFVAVLLVFLGFRRYRISGFGKALQMRLNSLALILAIGVMLLQFSLGIEAYVLAFGPICLFLSKHIEAFSKSLFRELALIGGLLVSLVVFIFGWIQQ